MLCQTKAIVYLYEIKSEWSNSAFYSAVTKPLVQLAPDSLSQKLWNLI